MPATREYSLDFLKVFATLLIILHHYQQNFGGDYTTIQYFGGSFYFGYFVELFFLLSGYFTFHMIRSVDKGERFFPFLGKRLIRLLPLMALAAVADQLIRGVFLLITGETLSMVPSLWGMMISALGLQSWGVFANPGINNPAWYISVLLFCYILFYFLTWVSKRLSVNHIILYVAVIFMGVIGLVSGTDIPFLNIYMCRGYAAFFFGLCLAELLNWRDLAGKKIVMILSLIVIVVFINLFVFFPETVMDDIRFLLIFLVYPSLLLLFKAPFFTKLFSQKIWGICGKISFDVYIWHANILKFFVILSMSVSDAIFYSRTMMIVFVLTSVAVGILSYYLIERPIGRCLKNKLSAHNAADLSL